MENEIKRKPGRPLGSKKPRQRKGRNIRAFDEEWELIYKFSKIVKKDMIKGREIMDYLMIRLSENETIA